VQGNLCSEYSVVWLLERADLARSDPLALDYLLAVTEYGIPHTHTVPGNEQAYSPVTFKLTAPLL
jgi:hypothetical protein